MEMIRREEWTSAQNRLAQEIELSTTGGAKFVFVRQGRGAGVTTVVQTLNRDLPAAVVEIDHCHELHPYVFRLAEKEKPLEELLRNTVVVTPVPKETWEKATVSTVGHTGFQRFLRLVDQCTVNMGREHGMNTGREV